MELIIKGKKYIIIGCIYKHPKLEINEFNTLFENTLVKLSFENKELYLLGDYNIDLLQTDVDVNIDEYYNIISSKFIVPHITLPTLWACGVVVSMFDFHRSDRGSNPGRGGEFS